MLTFRIKIILFVGLILSGCSSSNSEEYRNIDFASCSWRIPSSYESIRDIKDDDFRFREKRPSWDNSLEVPLIMFNREKSTKESFETSKNLHEDFRMSESGDYLLVRYQILIRTSEEVIGKGPKITVLVEKKTGHSVTLTDVDIENIVSGCEIPNNDR